LVDEDKDYFKLIIKGFKDNTPTGTVNFYLCTRKGDPENPDWSRVVNDWYPVDLSALGVVDKIVFDLESTDIEAGTGRMRTPAYFCLDGIPDSGITFFQLSILSGKMISRQNR